MEAATRRRVLLALLCIAFFTDGKEAAGAAAVQEPFNVLRFGARADGVNDDTKAFESMWKAACAAAGDVRIVVPRSTYLIGPVKFTGPCDRARSVAFHMKGHLKASTDLRRYGDEWVEFGRVDNLTLTGGGTFDGRGSASWRFNNCATRKDCKLLPTSLKFVSMTNTLVSGITSVDSKFFHVALIDCTNFRAIRIRISAPSDSPNTDGIHIERCSGVTISQAVIGTGDDCISVGHGNSQVSISGVSCGPGHGISVGSLGRYSYEKDVRGLIVRDSILSNTQNGVRIKTWANSPGSIEATNMTFQNIIMDNVANPIIIDQSYCPYISCASAIPSRVKISDIFFKNIRGTSSTAVAVALECSKGAPCQNVNLEDVHLDLAAGGKATASCRNVRANYSGMQLPPPCDPS